jgi:hypothetical protein
MREHHAYLALGGVLAHFAEVPSATTRVKLPCAKRQVVSSTIQMSTMELPH